MDRVIRIYLYILPFYSLLGIILSAFRTAYAESYTQYVLLAAAILDLLVLLSGWKFLFNKSLSIVFFLLSFSFLIGLLNNDFSRRLITDFTVPFFFFAKIILFKIYWDKYNFGNYIKYYTKVAFWGSLIMLPLVYSIFSGAGATRLAIFPPMELPFSFFMQNGGVYFFTSFIIILLYGKRAQLGGALITFALFIFIFKRNQIFKYIIITIVVIAGFVILFENYSNNLAINRLKHTYESIIGSNNSLEGLESVSAGRDIEIEALLSQLKFSDFIIGKGMGFTYDQEVNGEIEETANSHFTPLALVSKYGVLFAFYVYGFIISYLSKFKLKFSSTEYITAFGITVFVFIESFFAYALFMTPILPIALAYLKSHSKKKFDFSYN